jgi:hypothetical protein
VQLHFVLSLLHFLPDFGALHALHRTPIFMNNTLGCQTSLKEHESILKEKMLVSAYFAYTFLLCLIGLLIKIGISL